jgi:MFS family permease
MCAEKFGNRTTAFAATILATLGLVLSAYANSIWFMYVTFSVMTGLGLGISYMPGVKAVGEHFDKKRGIAMGLACAGVGMGSFLFPPIIK